MSLLARFHTEPLFLCDNTGISDQEEEEENGLLNNGQSSRKDLYDPAAMMPSQPSMRSTSTLAVPFSPRTQCVIKICGNSVFQKLELPDSSLDKFTQVSTFVVQHECTLQCLLASRFSSMC